MTAKKNAAKKQTAPKTGLATQADTTVQAAPETKAPATAPVKKGKKETKPKANASTVESPVKLVHDTCEKMKGAARKDIMAALLAKGVNKFTASTQIQRWRAMQRAK